MPFSTTGLPPHSADAPAQSAWNRALDVGCCLLALPVLILLTAFITVYTKLFFPGPVIFRQERVGLHGRRFHILKFRTMKLCAGSVVHTNHFKELVDSKAPMLKLDAAHDDRLIPGAWMIRASGLDELPQIINVLRGEMSLVGPRPCIMTEYTAYLPWQRARFHVLPGLTGLWQVSGKNRTTFEEMIRLDIRYSREASPWLNLKIISLTPWAMVRQFHDTRRSRRTWGFRQTVATSSLPFLPGIASKE
jgi:exopolysaccharide production protein ExoY